MIDREQAISLALAHAMRRGVAASAPQPSAGDFRVSDGRPARVNTYGQPDDPAWYISMPWYDGHDGRLFRDTRIVVIAKSDGRVLFDGGAGDEG